MIILFISAILYTVQLIVQHCNCLNLIDLPQGREAYSAKWRLASRTPEMNEPYPRKRGIKPYLRRSMLGNDRPGHKIPSKASRRVYEDEKDANLKNKLTALVQQTMTDTEDKMKEVDAIRKHYENEPPFRAGFVLSMVKKSREVLNELFNVAVKHRDEWQALEQLKIFELIVNTNVETNHLLKQLIDIQAGRDTNVSAPGFPPENPFDNVTTTATVKVKTPAVEVKTPAVEVKTPDVEVKTPAVEVEPSAAEVEPPAVEVEPPTLI